MTKNVLNLLALKRFITIITDDQNNSLCFQATEQHEMKWSNHYGVELFTCL